jgi:L-amino acid N-acyltransferase YncA
VTDSAISFETEAPGSAEMARRMESTLATHPWLVCERDGEIGGFAYAGPHRSRQAYRWASDVTVYVAPGHQRKGIGSELYGELIEQLRSHGMRMACAGITLPNDASVRLHESLGFRLVGVYRDIGWKAGEWRDVGWWQLDLGEPPGSPPPEPRASG